LLVRLLVGGRSFQFGRTSAFRPPHFVELAPGSIMLRFSSKHEVVRRQHAREAHKGNHRLLHPLLRG